MRELFKYIILIICGWIFGFIMLIGALTMRELSLI